MSRRVLLHIALIVAVLAAGGWLSEGSVATMRAAVAAQPAAATLTVCAKGCQFTSLQAAVNAARSGDTIKIKSGKALVGRTTIDGKDLTLDGDGQSQSILDGGNNGVVLTITNAHVIVQDVTIRNGNARQGGGIHIVLGSRGGSLNLQNSDISGNRATNGGGIANFGSNLRIHNSNIIDNVATGDGAGVYNFIRSGSVTIQRTEIKNNQAGTCGGGIFSGSTNIDLVNSDVNDNRAGARGGGFCATGNFQAILTNGSTVERNKPDNCFPANACIRR